MFGKNDLKHKALGTVFVGSFILVGKQLEPELRNLGASFNTQIPSRMRRLLTGSGTRCFWHHLPPELAAGKNYFDSSISCHFHFREDRPLMVHHFSSFGPADPMSSTGKVHAELTWVPPRQQEIQTRT